MKSLILSLVWVTVDGVWIGDCIYWPLSYIQLVAISTHSEDHCNYSTHKFFCGFTSRFLVTDPNNVLYLYPYRLTNIPQLTNSQAGGRLTLAYYSSFHWLTNYSQSRRHIAIDSQSTSKSWCRAPSGANDQIFITLWQLLSCFYGAPSLTRGRVCHLYMLLPA
jgi:hypothetical protein